MNVTINNKFKYILLLGVMSLLIPSHAQDQYFGGIKTVVIDPGHGGHDQGCHGASAKEKDIALAISLKLGAYIEKAYPSINLIYTRKTDVFVELNERAQIANRNNADLFICIHANSAGSNASGAETFVLGLNRTDSQEKVAERENSAIHLEEDGGEKYKDFDLSVDAIIARQLQLSTFLNHSIVFAAKVQTEMEKIGRVNRGVKQAGFLVLYKTTMPSVLIETGFLTNKEEEKFLLDTANQALMAGSFFTAFNNYKTYYESGYQVDPIPPKEIENVGPEPGILITDFGVDEEDVKKNDVIFKVQIETNADVQDLNDVKYKQMPVWEYFDNGFYKYTVGNFKSFQKANDLKKLLRKDGFENAFIVAFQNKERINLEKAIKFAEKE
ncbi:N-acetylmuramoyl-L-alanine amidase [Putridiphycobacter roseus]|uniref:N-acetylmuramoyl-L-alanine amidase n=1 Tax=Putridiphycobacter roseus TaxID=2219161 RepID=A0A2W1N0G1_9FLAO|nr:N-acetylmuramoyl-L-alanine amidase [Putridiphycobacter roseus]PZE17697.1 N-acetylmuramoyl-L-alanine amidase [Putridiphycobacter roseus]